MLRIGTEKKQVRWLIGLLTTAVLLTIYDLRKSFSTPSAAQSESKATVPTIAKKSETAQKAGDEIRFHLGTLLLSKQKMYAIGHRNIFRAQETTNEVSKSSTPSPQPPRGTRATVEQSSQPIPFTFYGFVERSNQPRQIFLRDHDAVFLAKLGDTIARHYKVIEVLRNRITVEDVLSNESQQILLIGR